MGSGPSMETRAEITAKYARDYQQASITVRKAGGGVEDEPGILDRDTVAHYGPTLTGEFARTVNRTCVHTGWVFTRSMRNNAHVHVLAALEDAVATVPFDVTGLDFDNGPESMNHDVIDWAAGRKSFFTRTRLHKTS